MIYEDAAKRLSPAEMADPALRKAAFREIARLIVWEDRHKRKYGQKVDMAGNISRALEQAFRTGLQTAQQRQKISETPRQLEWLEIPPRPRGALWAICTTLIGRSPREEQQGCLVAAINPRRPHLAVWRLEINGPHQSAIDRTYGDATIRPLIRRDLLTPGKADGTFEISALARTLWAKYIQVESI